MTEYQKMPENKQFQVYVTKEGIERAEQAAIAKGYKTVPHYCSLD